MPYATRAVWVVLASLAAVAPCARGSSARQVPAPVRDRAAAAPDQASPVRRIAVGQEVTDSLSRRDPRTPNYQSYHIWLFAGAAGQRVVIEMTSSEVRPDLILEDSGGTRLARDLRTGTGYDRRLDYTLPITGQYRIRASNWLPMHVGTYRLRLTEAPARRIEPGQEITDTLTAADPLTERHAPYHIWLFTGAAGQPVIIDMLSGTLNALVVLEDSSGTELARNDNFGVEINARLDHTLPYAGQYRIRATTSWAERVGAYRLRLTPVPPEGTRHIALGQEVTDSLTSADRPSRSNRAFQVWQFAGTAGQFVTIEMSSSAVDPHLTLLDSTGTQLASNDNGGGGSDARLNYTLRDAGEYRIIASSVVAGRFGEYTLRVTAGRVPTTLTAGVRGSIARGQTRTGVLTARDSAMVTQKRVRTVHPVTGAMQSGTRHQVSPYHAYLYRARAGTTLTIELRAPTLDPLVMVQEADGEDLASDDDGGDGLNARLTYTFPYAGTFRIIVTTVGARAGAYQLSVR
jgi:hypothetical protein